MGKGHRSRSKGSSKVSNAKPVHDNKQKGKFKNRSQQNQKQLAKLQRTINQGKSKGNQRQNKGAKHEMKPNNKNTKVNDKNFKKAMQVQQTNKTKHINKKNKKNKQLLEQDEELEQKEQKIQGNPLFQIIPEGMGSEDEFAALGQLESQEQEQSGEEYENGQGEQFDAEDIDQFIEGQQENVEVQDQDGEQLLGEQEQFDDQLEGQQEEQMQQDGEQFDQQGQEDEMFDDQAIEGQFQDEQNQDEGQQEEENIKEDQEQQNQQKNDEGQQVMQGQEQKGPVDISVISLKIQQTIQILMNVQRLGGGKPRKHFVEQLKKLIHQYYGYNFELISHFLDFLNPAEMVQLFEANQTQRPLTIRTNTLKTRRKQLAQSLIQRGVNLDPLAEWSKVGIKIYDTKVPIGATPEYLAGHYMLQSASSLLPVIAMDPQVGEKILDMAAAPGGKTTYIAQLMKNTGCIFANDLKKERLRALQFNLYRLGITNTAVICRDGRKLPTIFPGAFDRVLLDAPCTGLGIIAKDPSIKANRVLVDIYKNSHIQKQLLLAAIDCCKVNGIVIYSTCSISPLENEEVVNYVLKKRFVKIVECEVQVGQEGLTKFVDKRYHADLKKTRRIYPHVHNMDGFYVAKLVKVGKGRRNTGKDEQANNNQAENIQIVEDEEQLMV